MWNRSEAQLAGEHLAVRDNQELRVLATADGAVRWQKTWRAPVTSINVAGDRLVVAADKVTGHEFATGTELWGAAARGACTGVAPDGQTVVACGEENIVAVTATGARRWKVAVPGSVRDSLAERVITDGRTAYVSFRPRADQPGPLPIDVLAIAVAAGQPTPRH
jgi:hypothetical protein